MKNNLLPNGLSPSLSDRFSEVHLGIEECIFYLALHHIGDKRISRFINLYFDDPSQELEQICKAVNLMPSEFFGMVNSALYDAGVNTARILISTYNPLMVKRAIEHALSDSGQEQLIEFMRASGVFLPAKESKVNTKKSILPNSNYDNGLPKLEETLALGEKAMSDES